MSTSSSSSSTASLSSVKHIQKIKFFGCLGKVSVFLAGIQAEFPFVVYFDKHTLFIYGINDIPPFPVVGESEPMFQPYIEGSLIKKTIRGYYTENGIPRAMFTNPSTSYLFPLSHRLAISWITMEKNCQIVFFDPKHFDIKSTGIATIIMQGQSVFNAHFPCKKLELSMFDDSRFVGEFETGKPIRVDMPPDIVRSEFSCLSLSLNDRASIEGIRVFGQLYLKTNNPETVRGRIIAHNGGMVKFMGCKMVHFKQLRFFRTMSDHYYRKHRSPHPFHGQHQVQTPSLLDPAPSFLSSSSSSSSSSSHQHHIIHSDSDEEDNQSLITAINNSLIVDQTAPSMFKTSASGGLELSDAAKMSAQAQFKVKGNLAIKDYPIMNDRQSPCMICQTNQAVALVQPCGHQICCRECLLVSQVSLTRCTTCRAKIEEAVITPALLDTSECSFHLSGLIDYEDKPGSSCVTCKEREAVVFLSCTHQPLCRTCTNALQRKPFAKCPVEGCNKNINGAMILMIPSLEQSTLD